MKITMLGILGMAIESNGKLLMVDPYLLDTLHETSGEDFVRLVPVNDTWLKHGPTWCF